MLTYTPAISIFDGPTKNLISVLCVLIELLSRVHEKRGKSHNDFKFGIFVGRFPSDDAASMAVNGLIDFLVHASLFGKEER